RSAGAHIYDAAAADCARTDGGGWRLSFRSNGAVSLKARVVIDATGRAAWFARQQSSERQPIDRLVALLKFAPSRSVDSRTLIESCPEGWWYAAILPGQRAVCAFFTDSDLLPRGAKKREQHWAEMLGRSKIISTVMAPAAPAPLHTFAAASGSLDR